MCAVSLLVADDHEIVRRGIRALIQEQPGRQVAAEAKDCRDAVAEANEFQPDVAILDITMPSLNGLDAAMQNMTPTKLSRKALDAGARGYILKTDAAFDLITAVSSLLSNETFFTPYSCPDDVERKFRKRANGQ